MKMIKPIVNISKIADDYDTFVFGFNGVLSDGKNILPEVVGCLNKLAAMGKKIVVVSNSHRRVIDIVKDFRKAGVPVEVFSNIVSAGEILHYKLKNPQNEYKAIGNCYYHIGSKTDKGVFSGLDFEPTNQIEKAHFLYMSEVSSGEDLVDQYRPLLEQAVSFGLPFLCAGNDTSCFMNGKLCLAPAAVAEAYAILGGRIITFGKPDVRIVRYALEGLGDTGKVVIIGDNVATDIKVATLLNVDSVLVSKGRHVNFLGEGYIPDVAKTRELSNSYDVSPNCVISSIRW
ncbi:MAG: TIGR01459 family HAD-type hydrolase [Alphaproteobacteria bacterium]|nr:TIGR01459 family HAD-type hydrolase [Alphaproteobacteria bacterium]